MSRLAGLKKATSLSDVAGLLECRPKALSYILYKEPALTKYKTFQIPKRTGGLRTITAPNDKLKLLQRRLSSLLQDCVGEINVARKRKDCVAHGFKRKLSIVTNARRHRHRRWVFNLDLETFFPAINFGRVRGFFVKNRDFALNESVATVIAQIACHENALPQGSPCSPVIANLVANVLDMRLVKLASEAACTYSRYADDSTFSTSKRAFPTDIAVPAGAEGQPSHLWLPGEALRRVIERSGFRINAKKTHLMYRASRQVVTGLVVNDRVSVRSDYRHGVRAMVNSLVRTGAFEVLGATKGLAVIETRRGTQNELHGMLGFINHVDAEHNKTRPAGHTPRGDNRTKPAARAPKDLSSRDRLYRRFLMYATFYAAQIPVVICEGETDNAYLTQAIIRLADDFPDLATKGPGKAVRLQVRLYKYHRSSTAVLLGLNPPGGAGGLMNFIDKYSAETERFGGPEPTNPIVVLYDNDKGGKDVRIKIERVARMKIADTDPFVRVIKNMYAMHTPGVERIEDFFDLTTKQTVVDGRTLSVEENADSRKHYGKMTFAERVVRAKAETIDFSGFRPLLTNLVAIIKKHRASSAPLDQARSSRPSEA